MIKTTTKHVAECDRCGKEEAVDTHESKPKYWVKASYDQTHYDHANRAVGGFTRRYLLCDGCFDGLNNYLNEAQVEDDKSSK